MPAAVGQEGDFAASGRRGRRQYMPRLVRQTTAAPHVLVRTAIEREAPDIALHADPGGDERAVRPDVGTHIRRLPPCDLFGYSVSKRGFPDGRCRQIRHRAAARRAVDDAAAVAEPGEPVDDAVLARDRLQRPSLGGHHEYVEPQGWLSALECDPFPVGRPAGIEVVHQRLERRHHRAARAVPWSCDQLDVLVREPEERQSAVGGVDVDGTHAASHATRRTAERRHFPDGALQCAGCGGREIDDRAVTRPARIEVVHR